MPVVSHSVMPLAPAIRRRSARTIPAPPPPATSPSIGQPKLHDSETLTRHAVPPRQRRPPRPGRRTTGRGSCAGWPGCGSRWPTSPGSSRRPGRDGALGAAQVGHQARCRPRRVRARSRRAPPPHRRSAGTAFGDTKELASILARPGLRQRIDQRDLVRRSARSAASDLQAVARADFLDMDAAAGAGPASLQRCFMPPPSVRAAPRSARRSGRASRSTASVSSPRRGAAERTAPGVPDQLGHDARHLDARRRRGCAGCRIMSRAR